MARVAHNHDIAGVGVRACNQEFMSKRGSKEMRRRNNATYRRNHPEELKRRSYSSRIALKNEALSHYGEKCLRCGFSDYRALQIDHVNNNGAEERVALGGQKFSGQTFYRWLKRNGWPSGYQTLCANCNAIKHCEFKSGSSSNGLGYLPVTEEDASSNLVDPAISWGRGQVGKSPDSQSGNREFEPRRPCHPIIV